jgi:hexosaminidase
MASIPDLDIQKENLSPIDLIWPKPYNITTPIDNFKENDKLTGGWGKIAVVNPQQLRLNFGIPLKNEKNVEFIKEAFIRLQSYLSVYDVNDVAYSRMHFEPLRKNVKDQIMQQIKKLPGEDTLVIINLTQEGKGDKSCNMVDNDVDESYTMNINRNAMSVLVEINANSCIGILRSFSSLQHSLVYVSSQKFILGGLPLVVNDKPRFKWRGLMVDTSRHFIALERLKRIIDGMERLKLNIFHWHIVDSQSFPFKSKVYPDLAINGAYDETNAIYTVDEIKDFIEYAYKRGVRIIPEFDVPAHAASWGGIDINDNDDIIVRCPNVVKADDRLLEHGVDKVALNPLHPKIYDRLKPLFNEIFDLFPDSYVHFGGDEVNAECWETNDQIRKWKARYEKHVHTIPWHNKLQGIFTKKIFEMAKAKGKIPIVWDDTLSITDLTEDHVVQWWRGWLPSQVSIAHQQNFTTIASVGYYLDDLSQTWQKMYKQNIDDNNDENGLNLGGEAASWEEHADDENLDHRIFSRLPAVAERLWSSKEATASLDRIDKPRMGRTLCLLKQQIGLNVGPVFPDYCKIPRKMLKGNVFHHNIMGSVDEDASTYVDASGWKAFAILSFMCWITTATVLCYKYYFVSTQKRSVENSYSPVSTEEDDDERRLDHFDDQEI